MPPSSRCCCRCGRARREDGAGAVGLFLGTFSAAAVLGSVVASAAGDRLPRYLTYVVCFSLVGLPRFLVLGLEVPLGWVLPVCVGMGFACGFINPILGAVIYERIPAHLVGRVTSLNSALCWSLIPLGGLLGGALVAAGGMRVGDAGRRAALHGGRAVAGPRPGLAHDRRPPPGGRPRAGRRQLSPGNQSSISRAADSGESEPCTRFSRFDSEKSPRIVPGAALRPSVAPLRPRTTSIASSPSRTSATSGPLVTNVAQRRVEVPLDVLGVVLVGLLAVDRAQVHRDDAQALGLEAAEDLADQAAADGVGLEQDEGALRRMRRTMAAEPDCVRLGRLSLAGRACCACSALVDPGARARMPSPRAPRRPAPSTNITGTTNAERERGDLDDQAERVPHSDCAAARRPRSQRAPARGRRRAPRRPVDVRDARSSPASTRREHDASDPSTTDAQRRSMRLATHQPSRDQQGPGLAGGDHRAGDQHAAAARTRLPRSASARPR